MERVKSEYYAPKSDYYTPKSEHYAPKPEYCEQPAILPSLPPSLAASSLPPQTAPQQQQQRPQAASTGGYRDYTRTPIVPDPMMRMLPPRPHMVETAHQQQQRPQAASTGVYMERPQAESAPVYMNVDSRMASGGSAPVRRKLPDIPKTAKIGVRPTIPHEPHYPSSFHASFDEGMN